MFVKMLAMASGPKIGTLFSGNVYEVDDEFGKALLEGKYAEPADAPAPAARHGEPPIQESAAVDEGEKAVTDPPLIRKLTDRGGNPKGPAAPAQPDKGKSA